MIGMKKTFLFFLAAWLALQAGAAFSQGVYAVSPPRFASAGAICGTAAAGTGSLQVAATPPHAALYVNHVYVTDTPACVSGLAPGTYHVRLNLSTSYIPYQADVTVKAGETAIIHPVFTERAGAWFEEGLKAEAANDAGDALKDFQYAASGKPKVVVNAYAMIGVVSFNDSNWSAAVAAFRRFLFYRSQSAAAYDMLAQAYEKLGEKENAASSYEKAILNLPGFENLAAEFPPVSWKSISRLSKMLDGIHDPADRTVLGYLYMQKGDFDDSIREFKTVLAQYESPMRREAADWQAISG